MLSELSTLSTKTRMRVSFAKVAVVHHEGELELIDQLNEAAKTQNIHYLMTK